MDLFNAPIPGESLTTPVGNSPWEQPPKYAKVEEALDFYMEKFEDDEMLSEVLFLIEQDLPIEMFVNTLLLYAEMEGVHTSDTSMLVGPVVHEYVKSLCEAAGVKYREFQGKTKDEKKMDKKKRDLKILLDREMSETSSAPKGFTQPGGM